MPVLIAARSADLDLVRPLARLLRSGGGEVRCYLDTDDHELRDLGCKIAVGALDDAYNLEAALTRVHTFIPLLPDPFDIHDPDDLADLRVTSAGVDVVRSVIVSVLDVDMWAATVAAADDREDLDGTWELGGDAEPLVDLLERVPSTTRIGSAPSPWSLALLGEDLVVGASADEFLSG